MTVNSQIQPMLIDNTYIYRTAMFLAIPTLCMIICCIQQEFLNLAATMDVNIQYLNTIDLVWDIYQTITRIAALTPRSSVTVPHVDP